MKKYKYPFQNPELNFKKRVADLVSRLTLDEKIGLLPHNQRAIPRFGIKESRFGTEVARGYVSREPKEVSTVFPQPIGLAATFNPQLMFELGEICGIETRIHNKKYDYEKLMVWGPTVDLCRHPLWGRNEESYGEDPFLTGEMSSAYTKGMRGNHKKYLRVLSGLKHFCCNNHEEDRLRDNANVSPRLLREYYYAAFEPAIKGKGAHSVMTAYNELSGVPAMINTDLRKVCKKEWGMLFAVTDGGDFSQNVTAHKYSASHAETVALTIKAGNNIMTDNNETVAITAAKEAVKLGLVSVKELDNAISEVLLGRFMLGEFDPPEMNPFSSTPDELLNCDEFKKVNSRAAKECITLLKNDGLLPIKDDGKIKIAVVGLLADSKYKDWYTGMSDYNTTILSGLHEAFGERVSYHDGCDIVAIKSQLNGKYLQVNKDGSVTADCENVTPACLFKKINWDEKVIYISELNGKLLRSEEDDTGAISDAPTGFVNAVGNDTFEWFGRMAFSQADYCPEDGNSIFYKSWRNKDLAIDANSRLCEVDGGGITKAKLFEEEIVENGVIKSAILAQSADYVIVCLGNDPMVPARECFDRKSLDLPVKQRYLLDAVCHANENTVMTITSSYPYALLDYDPPAIIHTAHAGPEAGNAMADVLLGKYNPAGRTPQTWYKSQHDLPSIKDYDIMQSSATYLYFEGEELYPFGHGLSYSSFEYSDFSVKDTGNAAGGDIEATVKIKNTSDVYGEEVVQLYFTALNPRVKRPKIQLCEFIRQGIEPGKTIEISLVFDKSRLRFWDVTQHKFVVETGEYRFYAAASSKDIRCQAVLWVEGQKIPRRNMSILTAAIDYDAQRSIELRYSKKHERHYVHAPKWNGALDFYDVQFSGATGIEVGASTDINPGKIAVYVKDKLVGEIEIPACACPAEFKKRKCIFKEPLAGEGKLTLRLTEFVNLMDIKLL